MKTRNILFTGLVSVAALLSSCNDFQEINEARILWERIR